MDIPRGYHHRSPIDLPEICIQPSERFRALGRSHSYASGISPSRETIAMPILNARDPGPPPPLPPPRHLGLDSQEDAREPDLAWQWSNARENSSWGRPSYSVPEPGSSLYGSFASGKSSIMDERPSFQRRTSSTSTVKSTAGADSRHREQYSKMDEGYSSLSGTRLPGIPRQTESNVHAGFQSSVHNKFQNTASNYDNSLLKKLDSRRNTDENASSPQDFKKHTFSTSLNDSEYKPRRFDDTNRSHALSLPMPTVRPKLSESSLSGWANGATSATSLREGYPLGTHQPFETRSPTERAGKERTMLPYRPAQSSNLKNEDDGSNHSRSSRGSYDQSYTDSSDADFPMEETSGLKRLQIDDRMSRGDGYSPVSAAGQKRRASSPPRDDGLPILHMTSSHGDLFRRRESASRASPVPRLHSNHGSISSTASGARNNSYASTFSLAPSSISTISSYGRPSPGGLSPGGLSPGGVSAGGLSPGGLSPGGMTPPGHQSPRTPEDHIDSPYASPRGSVSSRPMHQRTASYETRPVMASRKSSTEVNHHIALSGTFICECCPKKPKKFDTADDLKAHEQEKQYECAYCKNRFKNKNEAERHQNSLHLRRHSWSCAALLNYASAFHISSTRPADADTCGYCGEEFLRMGPLDPATNSKAVSDRDWDARVLHLSEVHKFRECNHAKKFFRADHFRQHLKHSHAGTSGKWTNMLENACMKDEPLPVPRIREEEEN